MTPDRWIMIQNDLINEFGPGIFLFLVGLLVTFMILAAFIPVSSAEVGGSAPL